MGLSSNIKINKIDECVLLALSKLEDPSEFIEQFAQVYGSACEMWMNEEMMFELAKLYNSKKYDFKCLSGESYDGADDSAVSEALRKDWTLFADEQNGSSYDSIFFKTK